MMTVRVGVEVFPYPAGAGAGAGAVLRGRPRRFGWDNDAVNVGSSADSAGGRERPRSNCLASVERRSL